MKRTGIFAATAAGAIGATALVGGVGYTLAQDVAEQNGVPLDLGAVASVQPGQSELPTSSHRGASTDDTGDSASEEASPENTTDGGSGTDAGSAARSGGAAPVEPAPPVKIDPGKKAALPERAWGADGHSGWKHEDPRGHAPREQAPPAPPAPRGDDPRGDQRGGNPGDGQRGGGGGWNGGGQQGGNWGGGQQGGGGHHGGGGHGGGHH